MSDHRPDGPTTGERPQDEATTAPGPDSGPGPDAIPQGRVPRPPSSREAYLGFGAIGLMALIWGYNWVVMKVGVRHIEPAAFAAMRVFFGSLILFVVMVVTRRPLRLKNVWMTVLIALFQVSGSIGLATWAVKIGGAGKTSVLVYTMPVWLLLLSWFILEERLRGLQWVAVVLAIVGLTFVLGPWRMGEGSLLGSLLAVAAGFCWAASTVVAKILSRRERVDVVSLTAWQMLLGSIPLIVLAVVNYEAAPVWNAASIVALLFNIVLVSSVGLLLWFYAVRILPAGTAGLASLAAPVIGVSAAWIQLGERPDRFEATGMVLVIIALCVLGSGQIWADRSRRGSGLGGGPEG